MAKKDELSLMLKENIEGLVEELKTQIPHFDLSPPVSDQDIKQAILDMTPQGWRKLVAQYGQSEVTKFVNEFTARRKF